MRLDFATLAFGFKVSKGGGTPNWGTALGQNDRYTINDDPDIEELLKGVVYSSVSLSNVQIKLGKGGAVKFGDDESSPICVASVFREVYINDQQIDDGVFVLLITKDQAGKHKGRLKFKYGPSNTYIEDGNSYSNAAFWDKVKIQLKLEDDACFFVYDISVERQTKLILNTIVVNSEFKQTYATSKALHESWDALIESADEIRRKKNNSYNPLEKIEAVKLIQNGEICPEWFKEKANEFPTLDEEAKIFLATFKKNFSPEVLQELSGKDILLKMFLNGTNKTNLCYISEYDPVCSKIFGSIRSGNSYKYGLHYSQKNKSWVTGSVSHPQLISENEAIELGTKIRDNLIAGTLLIDEFLNSEPLTIDKYTELYRDLNDITDGYINLIWFLKYYDLTYPNLFPPIYSKFAQELVLKKLGIEPESNPVSRIGQIKLYVDECGISNVVFNQIFWKYCNNDNVLVETKECNIVDNNLENEEMKNCLEIKREPRSNKNIPINSIVYGAPGTGKTYSMVEHALAIIDNSDYESFKQKHSNRSNNIERYKNLIKDGRIVFTTFHQNYGYEDFIQGLRPDINSNSMAFKTVDGIFKTIADRALNDTEDNNYVIIIDEINRANISKVFGELITIIEEDKRWGEENETCVTLQSGTPFAVPNNLYIVGTMNSADKSISFIDAALRRRFTFIEQKPDAKYVPEGSLRRAFENINQQLVKELKSTDLLVGHSYFMNKNTDDLCAILNNNIIPLLYEYFYDNRNKVAHILNEVIKGANIKIKVIEPIGGRLCVEDNIE